MHTLRITRFNAKYIHPDLIQVKITVSGHFNMTTNTKSSILQIIGKHVIAKRGNTREIVTRGKTSHYSISERDLELLKKLKGQQKEYKLLGDIINSSRDEVDLMLDIAEIADGLLPS